MISRNLIATTILALGLVLASSAPGFAKDSRTVMLSHNAVVNGTTLPAGHYVVKWENRSPAATVEFTQGKKVIVTAQAKFEDRGQKFDRDAVVYKTASDGTYSISEIRLAGSSEVLVLSE